MAIVLEIDPERPDPELIGRAAEVLREGGLVAFPTETVYGLGADALNAVAVARIFEVKGRPGDDPIIVHVLDLDAAARVVSEVPATAERLARAFWPGPLTLVLPKAAGVPAIVTAGLHSVAVRAPAHPVARALITAAGLPVAAPSANRFGHTSPTTARHVWADLGPAVDLVLDGGPTPVGLESTVVDARSEPPRVLRPGGVSLERILAVCPTARLAARLSDGGPQLAPGQLLRHYAPRARLVLLGGEQTVLREALAACARLADPGRGLGFLVAEEDLPLPTPLGVELLSLGPLADLEGAARRLFAALRALDETGVALILARDWGEEGLGLAIRDRLTRAAEGRVLAVTDAAATAAAVASLLDQG